MSNRSINSEDLFASALELPIGERMAFVQKRAVDEDVREEVLMLLDHHQKNQVDEFFLDQPLPCPALPTAIESLGEKPGDTIGHFRLLEKIGEGGMGVVYMADQLEVVRRKVALKIIKLGMDTKQVVARFEVEQQAMALFDHPNIARVFDAGATESGRPYFVMELVRGTQISRFVEQNNLPLEDRLRLFMPVCNAVQHAHQKGIIHRDLKPSNILITQFDGVPVPKVIDFGIAKAIGQRLTEKTLFTRYAAMVGTPQYMSPEQAELTGIDVDTRSDIYSLGVLLYELITGSTPLRKEEVKQLNPLALVETLQDANIETPSSRLSQVDRNAASSNAGVDVATSRLKHELDWIVMKALSRDRVQRYATANEFAADVQRYLDGEPVLAAPPSKLYRLKSYMRKHRTAMITASLTGSVLLVSSITSGIFAVNAARSNNRLHASLENERAARITTERLKAELEVALAVQKYEMAHSAAFSKFMSEFRIYSTDAYTEIVSSPEFQAEDGNQTVCRHFDSRWLLEFANGQPFEDRAGKILRSFEKMEAGEKEVHQHVDSFLKDRGLSGLDSEQHQHNKWCLEVEKRTIEQLTKWRPKFFRILVAEYRSAFGEHDPRVRDGLTLLAASLIDVREYDLAESYLQQAIAQNPNGNNEIEKQILSKIETKSASDR